MADMIPQGTQEEGVPAGHEQGDANIRAVVMTMTVILSSAAVFLVVVWTMFLYFDAREDRKDAGTPPLFFAQKQVPPKPRLLPSPFDENDDKGRRQRRAASGGEARSSGVNALDKAGNPVDATSDDLLPWEKLRVEAAGEQAQVNSYIRDPKTGAITIPVERAKALMAPGKNPFTAKTQAGRAAVNGKGAHGESGHGTDAAGGHAAPGETGRHEGEAHSTAGQQSGAEQGGLQQDLPASYGPIYSESSNWETEDQSLTADSSGGLTLREKPR